VTGPGDYTGELFLGRGGFLCFLLDVLYIEKPVLFWKCLLKRAPRESEGTQWEGTKTDPSRTGKGRLRGD
jgi:hypothetical protein